MSEPLAMTALWVAIHALTDADPDCSEIDAIERIIASGVALLADAAGDAA